MFCVLPPSPNNAFTAVLREEPLGRVAGHWFSLLLCLHASPVSRCTSSSPGGCFRTRCGAKTKPLRAPCRNGPRPCGVLAAGAEGTESPGWVLQLAAAAAGVDAEKGACLPSPLWGLLGLMTKICWWLESEGHSSLLLCKAGSCELPGHRISRPSVFCRLRCLEQNNTSASCQLVFFL